MKYRQNITVEYDVDTLLAHVYATVQRRPVYTFPDFD